MRKGAGKTKPHLVECYLAEELGLDVPVRLHNAVLSEPDDTGEEYITIPDLDGLHIAAAIGRLRIPLALRGKGIRFLRKVVGKSGAEMADALGIAPETLSRYENDKQPIEEAKDRLLRLTVAIELLSGTESSARIPAVQFHFRELRDMDITPVAAVNKKKTPGLDFCYIPVVRQQQQPLEMRINVEKDWTSADCPLAAA